MGTGTFMFNGYLIQSMLVNGATPAQTFGERVFDRTSYDPLKWVVRDHVEGGFDVLVSGGAPVSIRYAKPLPESLVRHCREVLAGWNWVSAIFPRSKDKMAERVTQLLDCNDVKDALASALEAAVLGRNAFHSMLDDTLADTHADLSELMKGRQNIMRFLT